MGTWKMLSAAAVALAIGFGPVQAAPAVTAASSVKGASAATVTPVRWHGRHRFGRGVGIGLGLGILGGIVASEAYRPAYGYYYDDYSYDGPYYYPSGYGGDPRQICAQNFRSFEWNTGLYTTYSGEKRLCPYLR
jgi:hypothetical protein